MKRLWFVLTLGVFFGSCQEEDQITTTEAVQFMLSVTDGENGHTIADFPDNISIDIRLESTEGETTLKNINFSKTGHTYISEPVAMQTGKYKLNDFVIDNEKLAGSPGLFNDFFVSSKNAKSIAIGHAAFQSRGARPLMIAVYTEQEGKKKLTDAKVTIYHNESESYVYHLSAKVHHIVFKGDPEASYTLKIEKEGYASYTDTFIYNQLVKKRLAITLAEKSTELAVTFQPGVSNFLIIIGVMGKGSLTLDWGKGETEALEFDVAPEDEGNAHFFRDHDYATLIPPAKITGDLHLITSFYFDLPVTAVDLEHATGLKGITIVGSDLPSLDLHLSNELGWLQFFNTNIAEVILPQQHRIHELSMESSQLPLDYVISNIHANAVAANIHNGYVRLGGATVSEETDSKLIELHKTYGWWLD